LGERLDRTQEVASSSLASSTAQIAWAPALCAERLTRRIVLPGSSGDGEELGVQTAATTRSLLMAGALCSVRRAA
jgi:hypothetical protein